VRGFLEAPKQDVFVLQDQRNRYGYLEFPRPDQGQNPEGGTAVGTDGGNGNIRVNDHLRARHGGIACDTALEGKEETA
jgi:hypothetical protein